MGNNPISRIDIDGGIDISKVLLGGFGLVGAGLEITAGMAATSLGVGVYLVADGTSRGAGAIGNILEGFTEGTSLENNTFVKKTRNVLGKAGGGIGRIIGRGVDAVLFDGTSGDFPGPAEVLLGIAGDLTVIGFTLKRGFAEAPPSDGFWGRFLYGTLIGAPSGFINDAKKLTDDLFRQRAMEKLESGLYQYHYHNNENNNNQASIVIEPWTYGDYKESDFNFQ